MQIFFEIFFWTKKNHNAFHAILKKYIPTAPTKQKNFVIYLKNKYDTVEKRNEYMVKAMKKSYDEFRGNDTSRAHYQIFMNIVEDKLREKTNISDSLGVIDEFKVF